MSESPELVNESYVLYDRVMNPLTAQQERKTRKNRGMKRGLHSTSSSSAFDQPSSSHLNDDDDDDDYENDEGTSRASTPSPTRLRCCGIAVFGVNDLSGVFYGDDMGIMVELRWGEVSFDGGWGAGAVVLVKLGGDRCWRRELGHGLSGWEGVELGGNEELRSRKSRNIGVLFALVNSNEEYGRGGLKDNEVSVGVNNGRDLEIWYELSRGDVGREGWDDRRGWLFVIFLSGLRKSAGGVDMGYGRTYR
ncbi:hypothetical protein Tco_1284254 [Tanacetum coccineum]